MKKYLTGFALLLTFVVAPALASAQTSPTITAFGAKDPNPTTRAVTVIWQASGTTGAQLDVVCNPGTISFTTDKGNYPSCEKGGVWNWSGQSSGSIIMYPSGNTQSVTVDLILTLTNGQSQRMSVTFPGTPTNPTITAFAAKDPNPTTRSVTMIWNSSASTDAILEMNCTPGSISFTTDKGNYPSCEKGGVWSWNGQTSASIAITPSGNTNSVTVPFTLTLTKNGSPTGQTQTIYVTFPGTPQPTGPSITLFAAKDPNPTTRSVTMVWQSSASTDAILEMDCTPGSISFTTDKGNYPSCEKGGVWNWSGQTSASIAVTPSGNTNAVTVPFTLTLTKNGSPTGQSQKINVTFPATPTQPSAPTITVFGSKDPTPTNQFVVLGWQASGPVDQATIDVVCSPSDNLNMYVPDTGGHPICEKGGITYYNNQSSGSVMVKLLGNTKTVSMDFVLTLHKNGVPGDTRTLHTVFPPASVPSITSFTSTNQTNKSVTLSWQASSAIDASLDVVCTPGSISFTTSKGNYPSCEKGGVWSWTGQTGDTITVYPSGNTRPLSVDFVLKNTPNGAYTPSTGESRTVTIMFPASNSGTVPTVVTPQTNTNGALADIDTQSSSSCVALTYDLRYRSRDTTNGNVSALQDLLQSKGYLNSEPTGYFGLMTFQAVKDYQSANGISPTGFVGPITRAQIKASTCK